MFFEGDWCKGVIKKLHIHRETFEIVSSQVQVTFNSKRKTKPQIRWFNRNDRGAIAKEGVHTDEKPEPEKKEKVEHSNSTKHEPIEEFMQR